MIRPIVRACSAAPWPPPAAYLAVLVSPYWLIPLAFDWTYFSP